MKDFSALGGSVNSGAEARATVNGASRPVAARTTQNVQAARNVQGSANNRIVNAGAQSKTAAAKTVAQPKVTGAAANAAQAQKQPATAGKTNTNINASANAQKQDKTTSANAANAKDATNVTAAKTVSSTSNAAQSRPVIASGNVTSARTSAKNKRTRAKAIKNTSNSNNKSLIIGICSVIVVAVVILVAVIIAKNLGGNNGETTGDEGAQEQPNAMGIEEYDEATTKKVLDEVVDVTIGEYEEVEDENGSFKGINVLVSNKSDKDTGLGLTLIAKDSKGDPLDVSSIYTDILHAGETQSFLMFVITNLTPEELKSAKIEVYNAYTAEAREESNTVVNNTENSSSDAEESE